MKNKTNIIILTIIVIISSLLFLLGCNNIFSPQSASGNPDTTIVKKTGRVSLNITKKDYRTLLPSFSINHLDVTGDGPLSSTISLTDITSDQVTLNNLAVGEWTITALGKDSLDNTVAKGSVLVNIGEGLTTDATIDVHYLQDNTGTVNITINWPVDVSVDSIEFKKNSIDQTADVTSDLSFAGNSLNYLDNSAESNFYTYVFKFKQNNQVIATVFQSVHIYDYLTTSATISLSASNFSHPPVAPSGLSVVEEMSSLNINWTDNSNVEEGFIIERSLTSGGGFTAIDGTDVTPLPANTVNYTDNSVDVGVTYYYRILAVNSFGASPVSTEASGVRTLPAVSSLSPASDLTGVAANTNIDITFNKNINPAVLGTVQFGSPAITFQNGVNCSMSVSGNIVTINPNIDFTGNGYFNISVNGFQDAYGNTMIPYNNPDYNFTVNGLVAYYPFDGTADDMSGNENNISVTQTTVYSLLTTDRHGADNSAIGLDYGSYLDTGINGIPENFTISAWVNISNYGSMDQIIFSKFLGDPSNDDKNIEMCLIVEKLQNVNNVKFFMGNGTDYGIIINGNNNLSADLDPDKWYYISVTMNGSSGNMYINGILSGTSTFSGTRQTNSNPLYFGYYDKFSYGPLYLNGKLDDIRIYNYLQNATEILNIYNSEKPEDVVLLEISQPGNGQIVDPTTDFRLVFNSPMDMYSYGIIVINNPFNSFETSNLSLSTTNVTDDTLIINLNSDLAPGKYSEINIMNFKNTAGNTMITYTDLSYDFTVQGKIAEFSLNNTYSDTTYTYSGTTTNHPTPTTDGSGIANNCFLFDGTDDYIDTTISNLEGDFTLSAWIYNDDNSSNRPILSKDNSSDILTEFNLQVETGGNLNFYMGNGGGIGIDINGNNDEAADIALNTWYHIAVTMNGTTGTLYINGTATGSGIFSGTRQVGTKPIFIAENFNGSSYSHWSGKIDQIQIHNKSLNSSEISAICLAERPKVYVANILSPSDGAIDVSPDANIVIQFSGSLDGTTYGTVTFSQPDFTYTNGVNCFMSFTTTNVTNDTVIIDPSSDFVGMEYMNITNISGFKDVGGILMNSFANSSYNFVPKSISVYYKFDGNMLDYSGYPGTYDFNGVNWYNPPDLTTDRHSAPNKAYSFISANSYGIKSGNSNFIDIIGAEPRTMSLWVKGTPSGYVSDQVICALGTSDVDGTRFGLYVNGATDKIGFYGFGASNFDTDTTADSVWTQWAMSYDGTTVRVYKNGVLNASQTKTLNTGNGSYGSLYVGTWSQSSTSYFFDGCIDEVRMYNYALSDSEILSIYNLENIP